MVSRNSAPELHPSISPLKGFYKSSKFRHMADDPCVQSHHYCSTNHRETAVTESKCLTLIPQKTLGHEDQKSDSLSLQPANFPWHQELINEETCRFQDGIESWCLPSYTALWWKTQPKIREKKPGDGRPSLDGGKGFPVFYAHHEESAFPLCF